MNFCTNGITPALPCSADKQVLNPYNGPLVPLPPSCHNEFTLQGVVVSHPLIVITLGQCCTQRLSTKALSLSKGASHLWFYTKVPLIWTKIHTLEVQTSVLCEGGATHGVYMFPRTPTSVNYTRRITRNTQHVSVIIFNVLAMARRSEVFKWLSECDWIIIATVSTTLFSTKLGFALCWPTRRLDTSEA